MTDRLNFTAASDKDVFDLLMSAKQRMNDGTLRSIALKRGIIYSNKTIRERIASEISLLPHDYLLISEIIKTREATKRQDKMSCINLPVALTKAEILEIVDEYKNKSSASEEVVYQPRRGHDLYVNVAYDEIDYSKTRLIQRQRKDAGIEFVVGADNTTIRMPATEKGRAVAEYFRKSAERQRAEKLQSQNVELIGMSADQRTSFFMNLMRQMPGYQFQTLRGMRFASKGESDISDDISIDIDMEDSQTKDFIGVVNTVVLSGVNLENSEEYQSLKGKGYYITSARWQAVQHVEPRDVMQFDVSFEDGKEGRGFKYGVRVARRLKTTNSVTDKFEQLDSLRQPSMWSLIETTSLRVLLAVRGPLPSSLNGIEEKVP